MHGASTTQIGYAYAYDLAGDRQGNLMLAYVDAAATPIYELELALANAKAVLKYKNNAYSSVPEGSFLHRYDGSQWQASERVSDHSIRVDLADNGDILLAESRYSHSGTVGGQTLYYSDLYARRYTETAGWSELVIVAEDIVEAHTDISYLKKDLADILAKDVTSETIRFFHQELYHLSAKGWQWLLPYYLRFCMTPEATYDQSEIEFLIYNLRPSATVSGQNPRRNKRSHRMQASELRVSGARQKGELF